MSAVFGDDQSCSTGRYPRARSSLGFDSALDTHPSVARGHDLAGTRLYRRAVHDLCFIPQLVLDGVLA